MNYPVHPPSKRISERVGAFILRKKPSTPHELLLFIHRDFEEAPIQIPGGGVDPGESLEEALHREIYEESGLVGLEIVRKLGVLDRCWIDTQNTTRRHYFLLDAPSELPEQWDHTVVGNGGDAGLRFAFFWHRPAIDFSLSGGSGAFLNPHHIPELYTT